MSRRAYLLLAAAVTAFVLVLTGGVATYALRFGSASSGKSDSVPANIVKAREAEYRRLIDEANARLRAREPDPAAAPTRTAPVAARRSTSEREEDDRLRNESHRGREHREDDDG